MGRRKIKPDRKLDLHKEMENTKNVYIKITFFLFLLHLFISLNTTKAGGMENIV